MSLEVLTPFRLSWRWAALKNGLQDATAYRWEFFIEFASSALVPASVQWILWYAIFHLSGQQTIQGMHYSDLITYTWVSLLFNQVRGGDLDFELQEMIRTGQLSNYLLRPVGVVEFIFLRGIAPKLFIALICMCVGMIATPWLGVSPFRMVAAMILALIGNMIHYQMGATLSTAAFYWEESHSLLMMKNMVVNLLSGELIPLNLFPPQYAWVWKSLPFYFFVYGPTQYAIGRWSTPEFIEQLGYALLWAIGLSFLVRGTWRLGMVRYLSHGG